MDGGAVRPRRGPDGRFVRASFVGANDAVRYAPAGCPAGLVVYGNQLEIERDCLDRIPLRERPHGLLVRISRKVAHIAALRARPGRDVVCDDCSAVVVFTSSRVGRGRRAYDQWAVICGCDEPTD